MCGIAGILFFNNQEVQQSDLKKMTDTLVHRGPDGEGQWINEKKNIGFGHRRLSIIDLSNAGKQPMHFANNRFTITYNGEIYNYIEIREFLISKNYYFVSDTDTEVILAAYQYWGKDCLTQFDGMFAFAIWDDHQQELFCARDRFGEKPFYYYKDEEKFVFASEMKALFSFGITKEINRKKVFEYLLFLNVENPYTPQETFYKNIYQIPPSSFLKINKSNKTVLIKKYWDVSITTTFDGTEKQAINTFKQLFIDSIKKRLRSDVTVGSSLSGGLDSSSIVCAVHNLIPSNQEQHVFSARFPNFIKDEGKHITEVVNYCKHATIIQHEVFPTDQSILNNLKKIMYHQEMPFGSSSIAAQYEVMQMASENKIKVLLDGQGADEYLAGYSTFFYSYLKQLLRTNPVAYFIQKRNIEKLNSLQINFLNLEDIATTFFYNIYKKFGNKRRSKIDSTNDFFLGMHPDFVDEFKYSENPNYSPPSLKKHLKFMLLNRGLNELLRYADRNSMAHSVEVRLPFLNHKLVEFVFTLPEYFIIKNGYSKYILRKSMEEILPSKIQWRKDKIGYEPPQADWMKSKELVEMTKSAQQKLIKDKILSDKEYEVNWHHLMLGILYE